MKQLYIIDGKEYLSRKHYIRCQKAEIGRLTAEITKLEKKKTNLLEEKQKLESQLKEREKQK